ncbi:MAG: hypothetical protein C0613_05870 [Desulfobulbaceae bacterium]|nr:MAG: hypothetical protein C0613_05870 [Desulfobulbaceae bacterium]
MKKLDYNLPQLLRSLVVLALLGALAGWFFYLPYKMVRRNTVANLNAQQALLVRQAAHGIEEFFLFHEKLIESVAHYQGIIRLDERGKQLLDEFYQANTRTISAVSRVDADGRILYSAPLQEGVIGRDVSGQEHNRLLAESREPVVSSLFMSVQGYKAVAYAVPIFDQGVFAGSLSVLLPFEVVAGKYLANITVGTQGSVWLFDEQGSEIYCSAPHHLKDDGSEQSHCSQVAAMAGEVLKAGDGHLVYSQDYRQDGKTRRLRTHAVFHKVQLPHNGWAIAVASPEQQALASIRQFGRWWILLFLLFVGLLTLYAFFLFRARLRLEEERKREETEKKVAEGQKLFSRFINDAHLPIAMVNVESGAVEFLNEKFVADYGYTTADIPTIDAWFARAYPEDATRQAIHDRWTHRLEELRSAKHSGPMAQRGVVCKDGSVKEVEFAYTLLDDRMVITLNDKTEQRRVEQEKKELRERRTKARKMEALGMLAGGVAHDLNNILSGVVSYPDLLLLQLPEESEVRPAIEMIQQSGKQAAAVVADLLTVARGVACVKTTANLNSLIDEYLQSPEHLSVAAAHGLVSCVTELAPDLVTISCSAVHVKKCLMNLITNGFEALVGPGVITIATANVTITEQEAEQQGLPAGDYAVLRVSDSGPGIAEADLEHIFEPFYTKKEMGRSGTGLGLAVVWNTMQDHNGRVSVISGDHGTTFSLFFPASHEEATVEEQEASVEELQGRREKILVVDDQANQRDIACRFLDHLNYQCHAVASGEEALDYLAEQAVDLVVLDMIMGSGMDGCQTYAAMVRRHPGQKAVIASGFSENSNVREAQRLGAGEFIRKPYSMVQLGEAVKKALKGSATGR